MSGGRVRSQVCLVFGLSLFIVSTASAQLSLKDAFQAALQKTETTRIQDSRIQQAEGRYGLARSAALPHVGLNASYLRQDVPDNPGGTAYREDATNARLTATQALFHGFREAAQISGLSSQIEAQKQAAEFARISLFSSVATAYFNVLSYDKDLKNLNDLVKISENRIRELGEYTRLGRSRRSDLLVSQAQLATQRAQVLQASGQLINSREQFAYTTGLPAETPLADPTEGALPKSLPPLPEALATIEERQDVRSQKLAVDAAEQNVKYARGSYWPQLDLAGNYYLARTGTLDGSKWDIGLNLAFPFYEGGATTSAVQIAQGQLTEQRLNLEQTRRAASRDVNAAYKLAATGIDQLKIVRDSLGLTERAYNEVNRDFRRGASTNLDVLQALNALQDARRTLDRSVYQTLLAIEQLNIAQGRLPQ